MKMFFVPAAALVFGLSLVGCAPHDAPPAEHERRAVEAQPAQSVEDLLREEYADFAPDVWTFEGSVDLNADGMQEVIVHVVSPMLCGTGGCDTLVFTPVAGGYELVADISVSRPPIQVSSRSRNGWSNLLVHVSGGGAPSYDAELRFDGASYPSNPSVPPAEATTDTEGAVVVIPEFESLTDGKRLFDE